MYHVKVRITMDDGTEKEQMFTWWCEAADFVSSVADDCDSLPSVVTMTMELS